MGPLPGLLSACSEEEDCSMTARPMLQCNIYRAEYTGTLLRDTLDSLTVTAYATDSVIINNQQDVKDISIPLRYTTDSTVLVFHYDQRYRDTVGHPPREYPPISHFSRLRLPNANKRLRAYATPGTGSTLFTQSTQMPIFMGRKISDYIISVVLALLISVPFYGQQSYDYSSTRPQRPATDKGKQKKEKKEPEVTYPLFNGISVGLDLWSLGNGPAGGQRYRKCRNRRCKPQAPLFPCHRTGLRSIGQMERQRAYTARPRLPTSGWAWTTTCSMAKSTGTCCS